MINVSLVTLLVDAWTILVLLVQSIYIFYLYEWWYIGWRVIFSLYNSCNYLSIHIFTLRDYEIKNIIIRLVFVVKRYQIDDMIYNTYISINVDGEICIFRIFNYNNKNTYISINVDERILYT